MELRARRRCEADESNPDIVGSNGQAVDDIVDKVHGLGEVNTAHRAGRVHEKDDVHATILIWLRIVRMFV